MKWLVLAVLVVWWWRRQREDDWSPDPGYLAWLDAQDPDFV